MRVSTLKHIIYPSWKIPQAVKTSSLSSQWLDWFVAGI
jgi:hypothetical protein